MNIENIISHQDPTHALFAQLNCAAIMVDMCGSITASSAKAYAHLVEEGDRLNGRDFVEFLYHSDIPNFENFLNEAGNAAGHQKTASFCLSRDLNPVIYQCSLLQDKNGVAFGLICEAIGQAEDGAENIEDVLRWRVAIECAEQCTWDHDFSRNRHFVSDSWREMRGWTENFDASQSTEDWMKTIHPDDLDHVKEQIELQESGATDAVKYEFRQRHADGHWIWILSRGRVVRRNQDGQTDRIIGIDLDITDMKVSESERFRIGERLAVAMDASQMAHWEMKIGSDTTYWDNRALEIFGLTDGVNDRRSIDFEQALHPDDRAETMAYWKSCIESKTDVKCDFRIVTPDGQERYIRTAGAYIEDEDGGGRFCGVNLDLTEDHLKTQSLKRAHAQLEHESRHDSLTGLANRRRLDEVFREIRADLANQAAPPAAMHIDLDHFQSLNDTFGHDVGDAALKKVAQVLVEQMPSDALVARVGGDEFVVLLPCAPGNATLRAMAKTLIQTFAVPFEHEGVRCKISVSIGIANYPVSAKTDKTMFINADLALYQAKREGRGTLRYFNSKMRRDALNRQSAQDRLRIGLEQGELTCFYQPQFDAKTLCLTGLEALVRWNTPERGVLTPDAFLDTAYELGLTSKIDELVLRQALDDLADWEKAGLCVPRISVNISAQRIGDPTLEDHLKRLAVPEGKIAFELLESTFLDQQNDDISDNLDAIRALGIEIEIDDFGTGHASIVSLLKIEPARLKIDRALVDPILTSAKRKSLLQSLITIGKTLNVKVVAEGVETHEHVRALGEMGCDYLQGYALGRPMPREAITALLASRS